MSLFERVRKIDNYFKKANKKKNNNKQNKKNKKKQPKTPKHIAADYLAILHS